MSGVNVNWLLGECSPFCTVCILNILTGGTVAVLRAMLQVDQYAQRRCSPPPTHSASSPCFAGRS